MMIRCRKIIANGHGLRPLLQKTTRRGCLGRVERPFGLFRQSRSYDEVSSQLDRLIFRSESRFGPGRIQCCLPDKRVRETLESIGRPDLFYKYCFEKMINQILTQEFIEGLIQLIRVKLQIPDGQQNQRDDVLVQCEGDGALSAALMRGGIQLRAIDDQSWSQVVSPGAHVEKISAQEALLKYNPKIVLASWPPPAEDFEIDAARRDRPFTEFSPDYAALSTDSVQTYVQIGLFLNCGVLNLFLKPGWQQKRMDEIQKFSIGKPDNENSGITVSEVFLFQRQEEGL